VLVTAVVVVLWEKQSNGLGLGHTLRLLLVAATVATWGG
jgi:hypothetical protein